jgi:putative SOS response-associated peptidase YedK
MCGRFAFYSPAEAVAALFDIRGGIPELEPRYNIAPTQAIAAGRETQAGERQFVMLRWGLVPHWAKDPSVGNRMINARVETAAEKPSFRAAFRQRRCIIFADGFYEWRKEGSAKTPYFISLQSGLPFAFAGLWEAWTDRGTGESLQTAAILTTEANEFLAGLHDRMPVVLDPEAAGRWLGRDPVLPEKSGAGRTGFRAWPVSRRVNTAVNEGPDLVEPAGPQFAPARDRRDHHDQG